MAAIELLDLAFYMLEWAYGLIHFGYDQSDLIYRILDRVADLVGLREEADICEASVMSTLNYYEFLYRHISDWWMWLNHGVWPGNSNVYDWCGSRI
jgi:hypothetical protein